MQILPAVNIKTMYLTLSDKSIAILFFKEIFITLTTEKTTIRLINIQLKNYHVFQNKLNIYIFTGSAKLFYSYFLHTSIDIIQGIINQADNCNANRTKDKTIKTFLINFKSELSDSFVWLWSTKDNYLS